MFQRRSTENCNVLNFSPLSHTATNTHIIHRPIYHNKLYFYFDFITLICTHFTFLSLLFKWMWLCLGHQYVYFVKRRKGARIASTKCSQQNNNQHPRPNRDETKKMWLNTKFDFVLYLKHSCIFHQRNERLNVSNEIHVTIITEGAQQTLADL